MITTIGREMAAALAAVGKPHKLLLIKEVDDSYLRAEYAELERFLAEHLRCQATPGK